MGALLEDRVGSFVCDGAAAPRDGSLRPRFVAVWAPEVVGSEIEVYGE
jgi:hypothetical protein